LFPDEAQLLYYSFAQIGDANVSYKRGMFPSHIDGDMTIVITDAMVMIMMM